MKSITKKLKDMKKTVIILSMILMAAPAFSQDEMKENIYPPALVIRYKSNINLTPEQEEFIKQTYNESQQKFNNLKWEISDAKVSLNEALSASKVNKNLAIGHLEDLLELERKIKVLRMDLYIEVKNKLTKQQQQKLDEMRRKIKNKRSRRRK